MTIWRDAQRDWGARLGSRYNPRVLPSCGVLTELIERASWYLARGELLFWCPRCKHWCDLQSKLCAEFCPEHYNIPQFDILPELEPPKDSAA